MEELKVIEQGFVIGKESDRFIVRGKDLIATEVPSYAINSISIYGNNQITTQAITMALDKGIDINFLSTTGKFKGKISSNKSKNIPLRLKQYALMDDIDYKLQLSIIIVSNKIRNQYNLLKYYNQNEEELINLKSKVEIANTIEEVMGYEGMASRIYFNAFGKIVPEGFKFTERNRRPPKDEVNALLSLTYQVMLSKIMSNLEVQGLDTTLGILHSIKYGRESLALDMLEEFRQGFCDAFVMKILKRKQVKKEDFIIKDGGCYFKDNKIKDYFKIFDYEYKSIEKDVRKQAFLIRKSIEDKNTYVPYGFNKRR